MKIAVIHRTLALLGGGERVCMSLLRALDRTRHETTLRCIDPPPGVQFAGDDGGDEARAHSPVVGGEANADVGGGWGWETGRETGTGDGVAAVASAPAFRSVRLARALGRPATPGGAAFDLAAEVRSLFRCTGCDVAVVTDGGLMMGRTDASRVVWYCNTALRSVLEILSLPRPRHPRNILRLWRFKRPFRTMMAAARGQKVEIVPNSEYTRNMVSSALGREVRGPAVYPPVDVRRFAALRSTPKERRTATVARFGPEKNLGAAVRIMRMAGGRYDIVGNMSVVHPDQIRTLEEVRRAASGTMRLHVNAGQGVLEEVVGGARAYLQTSEETFGVAVAEAIAAGCVPIVHDHTAHPETVPFTELRYRTEDEAAGIVRGALDGRFDGLLPALQEHVQQFSDAAFQEAMLGIIEGRGAE